MLNRALQVGGGSGEQIKFEYHEQFSAFSSKTVNVGFTPRVVVVRAKATNSNLNYFIVWTNRSSVGESNYGYRSDGNSFTPNDTGISVSGSSVTITAPTGYSGCEVEIYADK